LETRTRLLKAAKSVFEDNGFLAARISDITKRAGLSHGSFYNYFDSKQEIFREVASAMQQQFGAHSVLIEGMRFDSVADPILPEWFAELYRRFLEEYRREARIMGVIEQVSRYDDDVRAARLAHRMVYRTRAEDAFRGMQRAGFVDKRLDPENVVPALTALINLFRIEVRSGKRKTSARPTGYRLRRHGAPFNRSRM